MNYFSFRCDGRSARSMRTHSTAKCIFVSFVVRHISRNSFRLWNLFNFNRRSFISEPFHFYWMGDEPTIEHKYHIGNNNNKWNVQFASSVRHRWCWPVGSIRSKRCNENQKSLRTRQTLHLDRCCVRSAHIEHTEPSPITNSCQFIGGNRSINYRLGRFSYENLSNPDANYVHFDFDVDAIKCKIDVKS